MTLSQILSYLSPVYWFSYFKKSPQPVNGMSWEIPKIEEFIEKPKEEEHIEKRTNDWSMYYLRRDLADTVSYILDRFENLRRADYDYALTDVPALGNLWGCDFLLLDRELGERMKGGDKWSTVEAKSSEYIEAMWPIEYAFVLEREGYIELFRFTSITAKEVRGKVKQVVPKMMHFTIGRFSDNGAWGTDEFYVGLVNEKWVSLESGNLSKKSRKYVDEMITWLLPSIFTARYEWHVALGTIEGGPRLLLPTNPAGCLQLFKYRDISDGKSRREKLRHWVGEHWRENETGLAYVCNHLRGKTRFRWSDMGCELFVSQYDLEKNEIFRKQADEWRSQRKHNRARVRLKRNKQ